MVPLAMRQLAAPAPCRGIALFVAVGLGYILVEIAFIQRFVLFLGHPTYALTVVVFLLLLSSGAGSLVSRDGWPSTERDGCRYSDCGHITAIRILLLPGLLNLLVGLPFRRKAAGERRLLVPLGFAMGMPFPTGLRALAGRVPGGERRKQARTAVEWAWAMNAASSVMGSVLAIVIAIQFGLNITLACGAVAYFWRCCWPATLRPPIQSDVKTGLTVCYDSRNTSGHERTRAGVAGKKLLGGTRA